ncbi:hypothetical protein [Oricola indica]|uniref:hypothetical protein n=1 Tax=Oricola indica TaxID=2872591 RepID=UPI001CBCCF04|nr:hypothetical protein [Oricola indica]
MLNSIISRVLKGTDKAANTATDKLSAAKAKLSELEAQAADQAAEIVELEAKAREAATNAALREAGANDALDKAESELAKARRLLEATDQLVADLKAALPALEAEAAAEEREAENAAAVQRAKDTLKALPAAQKEAEKLVEAIAALDMLRVEARDAVAAAFAMAARDDASGAKENIAVGVSKAREKLQLVAAGDFLAANRAPYADERLDSKPSATPTGFSRMQHNLTTTERQTPHLEYDSERKEWVKAASA